MRYAAALALLVACSVDPVVAPRDCTPGQTSACVCPGAAGVQTCTAEGTLGACVCPDAGTDATSSDAPVVDVPVARPDVVTAADVVDVVPGVDVVDAGAPPSDVLSGGDAECRRPGEPIIRRCTSDNDCNACAPGVSGFTWCCGVTGYCENWRACDPDAGFRPYQSGVQSTCENLGQSVVRCREDSDCARACAPRTSRVWCCSAGFECGTREAVSCR